MRDYQKSKVYKWENKVVGPWDSQLLTDNDEIQDFINFVWVNEGFQNPPRVKDARKNSRTATGSRTEVVFPPESKKRWIILHELSHSLNRIGYVECDRHGPNFVKIYVNLLEKHLYMNRLMLLYTLKESKIDIAF